MKPAFRLFLLGLALGTASTLALRRFNSAQLPGNAELQLGSVSSGDRPSPIAYSTPSAPYAARADALRAFVASLPTAEFPHLLATFTSDSDQNERRLCQIAFDSWVDLDPAAATRWAAAGGKPLRDLALQAVRAWAELDAPAAAAWACALPDAEAAAMLANPSLVALAAQDSARAIALANSRDDAFRDAVLPALLTALAEADPAATVRAFAPALWKGGAGFQTLRGPLSAWARRDPDGLVLWMAAQPGGLLGYAMNDLVRDPAERRALVLALAAHPELPRSRESLREVFTKWGRAQPTEALAWLDQLGDPALRVSLLHAASFTYNKPEHPELPLPFVLALPAGRDRTERLGQLLSDWSRLDRPATQAWMAAQNDPGVAAAAYTVQASLLATIAHDEPATAVAEWRALSDPRAQKAALDPIVQAWGKSDPAAALQWGAEQQRALGGDVASTLDSMLLLAWAQKEPETALRWTEPWVLAIKASGKPTYTYLFDAFGSDYTGRSRAASADLLTKIQDPALRTETLTRHVQAWLVKDPAAAKTWLESNDALTPAQAAALLQSH
jgi:hypothetical protein